MGATRLADSQLLKADKTETTGNKILTSGVAAFGAWVELFASTTFMHNWIHFALHDNNTSNEYEIEIGDGAAGSEVPRIKGILYHVNLTGMNQISEPYSYKVEVSTGERISARVKATNNTDVITIKLSAQGT